MIIISFDKLIKNIFLKIFMYNIDKYYEKWDGRNRGVVVEMRVTKVG